MAIPTWFNKEQYLTSKLQQLRASGEKSYNNIVDVEVAIEQAGMTAFSHFEAFGLVERTSPNQYFNAHEYLAAKSTQMNNVPGNTQVWTADSVALAIRDAGMSIWSHFQTFGWAEGVNPSNSFDVKKYLETKLAQLKLAEPDAGWTLDQVKAAFTAAGTDPISHFSDFGKAENLTVTEVPEADRVPSDSTGGSTFTLTTGADTGAAFTGTDGNDIFEASVVMAGTTLVDTLQNIDSLTGGKGIDTLNATLNTTGAAKPTLNGVEIVNLRATATAAGAELDLSAATGVTNVNVKGSTGIATLTSIGAAAVGVADQNQNVNINGSTATALNLNLNTVGTKTTDITVDLAAGTANAATSYAITANNAHVTLKETTGSAVTTSASVAATGSNELTFGTADLASLTSLTVTGSGDVDFTGAALTGLKTLTVADGGVKVDATGGVLETATTGAGNDTLTLAGGAVKNISTGAGNDSIKVTSALLATSVVDLGAGDDRLTLDVAPAAGATLTAGDGTDTLGLLAATYTDVSALGAPALAKVTGFEVLSISDTLATTADIDVSKIAGIVSFEAASGVANAATAAKVTGLGANSTVTLLGDVVNNGVLAASLKTDTAADSMTLVLKKDFAGNNDTTSTATAATSKVAAADVESLTANSTGVNTLAAGTVLVDGYKVDTITNTLDLTGSNKLTSITVTGDQALVLASTAGMTKLATIDASANTGGVTIDASLAAVASPSLTIKGTAKADTISGGLKGDTITLGAGNDILDYTKGASKIGTGSFDTITDFTGNTFGNSTVTAGATGTGAGDATKWTGDVLKFTGDAAAAAGALVDVFTSGGDATTFLANNKDHASGITAALDSSTGNLYVDNTADGVADFFIQLTGVTTINAAAFEVVVV